MNNTILFCIAVLALSGCGDSVNQQSTTASSGGTASAGADSKYTGAVYTLVTDDKNIERYRALAGMVGFDIGRTYSYTDYAKVKSENELGTAGNYDFLLFSTGGNAWDYEAEQRFNQQGCGWEMVYYKNHDLTLLHEVCHSPDRSASFVRILKASKGRNERLYAE